MFLPKQTERLLWIRVWRGGETSSCYLMRSSVEELERNERGPSFRWSDSTRSDLGRTSYNNDASNRPSSVVQSPRLAVSGLTHAPRLCPIHRNQLRKRSKNSTSS